VSNRFSSYAIFQLHILLLLSHTSELYKRDGIWKLHQGIVNGMMPYSLVFTDERVARLNTTRSDV